MVTVVPLTLTTSRLAPVTVALASRPPYFLEVVVCPNPGGIQLTELMALAIAAATVAALSAAVKGTRILLLFHLLLLSSSNVKVCVASEIWNVWPSTN